MKRNIIYILLSFVFFMLSCEEDTKFDSYDLGTEIYISDNGFTSLDDEVTIEIDNPLDNLAEVTVHHLGGLMADGETSFDAPSEDLGTVTISGGKGTITLSDTDLGLSEIGMSADLEFAGEFGGKSFFRPYTLSVDDPIAIDAPELIEIDTILYLKFEIVPATATVTGVTVQTKVNSGTYADVPGPWSAKDSIGLNGSDYSAGDTLYVNVIGETGSKTAATETQLVIGTNSYQHTKTFKLDTTTNLAIDLIDLREVDVTTAGDSADMELVQLDGVGGFTMGFISNQNARFVKVVTDGEATYDEGNIVEIEATNFVGAIIVDTDVAEGDVFIFRTRRGVGAYSYGIMKIITVDKPQGVKADSYIEIEVKY